MTPPRHEWRFPPSFAPWGFAFVSYGLVRYHSSTWTGTLTEVAAALAALGGILLVLNRARERLSVPRGFRLPLAALAVSVAVSTAGSPDPREAWPRLLLYGGVILLAAAVYLIHRDGRPIRAKAYFLAIAIVQVPYTLEVIGELAIQGPPFFVDGPSVANFANVRHYGQFCFLAATAGSALLILSRAVILPFLLTSCALFGLIATGSRGSLLAWLCFLAMACCLDPARVRAAVVAGAALLGNALAVGWLQVSGLMKTPNIFTRVADFMVEGSQLDSGRVDLWLASAREFAAHPFFGNGPEGYFLSGCCNTWVSHPHNVVLQFLMEFGVVGGFLLLGLMIQWLRFVGGLRELRRRIMHSSESRVLAAALVAFSMLGLIDGMFYFAVPLLHFALWCGLFAAAIHQAHPARQAHKEKGPSGEGPLPSAEAS